MPTEDEVEKRKKCWMEQSDSYEDDDIYVNADDGLNLNMLDVENEIRRRKLIQMQMLIDEAGDGLEGLDLDDIDNDIDFPTNLIVTGLTLEFFEDDSLKRNFESLFLTFGEDAVFHYFKSFKRVRVTFNSASSAISARIKTHMSWLSRDIQLKCYFGQAILSKSRPEGKDSDGLLHPPTPDKQFLISPPASPPLGWQPIPEYAPTVNFDLLSALAKLTPGKPHELFKPESDSHPSIFVHIADDPVKCKKEEKILSTYQPKPKIQHTKRPE